MGTPPAKRSHNDSEESRKLSRKEEFAFPVHPLSKYNGNCAVYKQPVELLSYSIDHERSVHFDDRQLVSYLSWL
jgi:hypothetical protein